MKKISYTTTLILIGLLFTMGCETGITNKTEGTSKVHYTTVNKTSSSYTSYKTSSTHKIFSNSATPGYYLQVGFFKKYKPNNTFTSRLKSSDFPYTILEKKGNYYALIGPYKSLNSAKSELYHVKSALNKQTFPIQVLRP